MKKKKNNSSINLQSAFMSASVDLGRWRSLFRSLVFGFFILQQRFLLSKKLAFFSTELCWTKLFIRAARCLAESPCRWRVKKNSAGGWACGWLVSAVLWAWIKEKLFFPWPFSKRKRECSCAFGSRAPVPFLESAELSWTCPILRRKKFADPRKTMTWGQLQNRRKEYECTLLLAIA